MDDQQLVKKIRHGSDEAFRKLVIRYQHDVYRTIYAVLRHPKDAEDATQEVFVKIYHSISQYEGQGLKTWMTRIAVNHAIDVKRKLARRQEEIADTLERSRSDNTVQHLIHLEEKQLVRQRITELPEGYREVVVDFYINEKNYQQIATEHQLAVKNVEMKLYRARQWMKKNWKEDEFS